MNQDELEQLKRDAARYRFLRGDNGCEHAWLVYQENGFGGTELKVADDLDDAVDHALEEIKKNNQ